MKKILFMITVLLFSFNVYAADLTKGHLQKADGTTDISGDLDVTGDLTLTESNNTATTQVSNYHAADAGDTTLPILHTTSFELFNTCSGHQIRQAGIVSGFDLSINDLDEWADVDEFKYKVMRHLYGDTFTVIGSSEDLCGGVGCPNIDTADAVKRFTFSNQITGVLPGDIEVLWFDTSGLGGSGSLLDATDTTALSAESYAAAWKGQAEVSGTFQINSAVPGHSSQVTTSCPDIVTYMTESPDMIFYGGSIVAGGGFFKGFIRSTGVNLYNDIGSTAYKVAKRLGLSYQNNAQSGLSTQGMVDNFSAHVTALTPKILVMMTGGPDLVAVSDSGDGTSYDVESATSAWLVAGGLKDDLTTMFDAAATADIDVYIYGIPPRTVSSFSDIDAYYRTTWNAEIKKLADSYSNVHYFSVDEYIGANRTPSEYGADGSWQADTVTAIGSVITADNESCTDTPRFVAISRSGDFRTRDVEVSIGGDATTEYDVSNVGNDYWQIAYDSGTDPGITSSNPPKFSSIKTAGFGNAGNNGSFRVLYSDRDVIIIENSAGVAETTTTANPTIVYDDEPVWACNAGDEMVDDQVVWKNIGVTVEESYDSIATVYDYGDGTHFNAAGYDQITDAVINAIKEELARKTALKIKQ